MRKYKFNFDDIVDCNSEICKDFNISFVEE